MKYLVVALAISKENPEEFYPGTITFTSSETVKLDEIKDDMMNKFIMKYNNEKNILLHKETHDIYIMLMSVDQFPETIRG